jgi:LmbE family N-acetylglucosaminyl deacetylase
VAGRLLGVFAHPDDEVFCMGGCLAKYSRAGASAMVLSLTRGEAGQIRDVGVATRRTLGAVREAELAAACAELGVAATRCLDHRDGTLASIEPELLVKDVIDVIREFRPDVVVTFGSDGAYGHPDHVAASAAATTAVLRLASEDDPTAPARLYHSHFPRSRVLLGERLAQWLVRLAERFHGPADFGHALTLFAEESSTLRYASDHIDVQWYPDGLCIVEQGEPASSLYLILSGEVDVMQERVDGSVVRLRTMTSGQFFGELGLAGDRKRTATVVARGSATCLVLAPGEPSAFGGRGEGAVLAGFGAAAQEGASDATTVVDVREFVERKAAAIAAHRSQFPIPVDLVPHDVLVDLYGTEHFVRLYPPPPVESELFPP